MAHSSSDKGSLYLFQVLYRTPALSHQAVLGHVQVEHVHGVVDGLHLGHLAVREMGVSDEHEREK